MGDKVLYPKSMRCDLALMAPLSSAARCGSLLLAMLCTVTADAQKLSPKKIFELHRDAVVQVEVKTREGLVTGTGFFYQNGGTVATCYHVVEGATAITVRGTNNRTWTPKLITLNIAGDTALLHLGFDSNQTPILHGASQSVAVGNEVIVIGNPLGLEGSLSTGVVAAKRSLDGLPLLQITAPISRGSSGSPVLDTSGRAIGLASFSFTRGQNVNMAVSTKILHETLEQQPWNIDEGFKFFASLIGDDTKPPLLDPKTGQPVTAGTVTEKPVPDPKAHSALFETDVLPGYPTAYKFVNDGKALVVAAGNKLMLYPLDSPSTPMTATFDSDITVLAPRGSYPQVILAFKDGTLRCVETTQLKTGWQLTDGREFRSGVCTSDGRYFIGNFVEKDGIGGRWIASVVEISSLSEKYLVRGLYFGDNPVLLGGDLLALGKKPLIEDLSKDDLYVWNMKGGLSVTFTPTSIHSGSLIMGDKSITSFRAPHAWAVSPSGSMIAVYGSTSMGEGRYFGYVYTYSAESYRAKREVPNKIGVPLEFCWPK